MVSVSFKDDERSVAAGDDAVNCSWRHDQHAAGVDGDRPAVDEQVDPSIGDKHRFRIFVLLVGVRFIQLQNLEIHVLSPQ